MINPTRDEILKWLGEKDPVRLKELFREARACAVEHVGPKVYFRGIIELGNICTKDCSYCGIRSGNPGVNRYQMPREEILGAAREAFEMNYGSVVLQAGERQDEAFIRLIEEVIQGIKTLSGGKLGITLSLGEQTAETYGRWFKAGAHRYLLRIESSDPVLYRKLHPEDHSFEVRLDCLRSLKRIGYQTGTGVMIGLPWQTHEDLAGDILFFERENIDMIGMGPYIPHEASPLANEIAATPTPGVGVATPPRHPVSGWRSYDPAENFRLGLVMIALTRLFLKDVNIAAATALQAIDPAGREKGVMAGANIIMPNITPVKYRGDYQLYEGKPCVDEDARKCSGCLELRVRNAGAEIGYGEWGDPVHFMKKKKR